MESDESIAFWLLPVASAHDFFRSLISELAERYDAPRFEPHVTLCSGELREERARDALRNLSVRMPIELEISGIKFSASYTKTLFVQFRSTAEIEALNAEVQKAIGSTDELNPHLSLLYKEMSEEKRVEAARAVALPFHRVTFDTVKAIVTTLPIHGRAEVESWRDVASRRLHCPPD